jgi:tetratricopeptide (TPR) repeat protein
MFDAVVATDLPPPIDPWWDLYLPATFGEVDAVLDALELAEASAPLLDRGDLYAVAARAFAVLGRPKEAERLAAQAFQLGGAEADALATYTSPDGLARCRGRLAGAERPGVRADAACDLAARHLIDGNLPGARAAVAQALAACPDHGEAGRWVRLLEEPADLGPALVFARDQRRTRAPRTVADRDVLDLVPCRRTGWLSAERFHRRILGVPPRETWAHPRSALGHLQDAGIGVFFFALDWELGGLKADHPVVELEVLADVARARVDEGRDALPHCRRLWEAATALDETAQDDAAQLLAGLGTADARLAVLAIEAVDWLTSRRPERGLLWEGYLAWLGHLAGIPSAAERARALVRGRPADPTAWRLGLEVLRAEGFTGDVERALRAAAADPALAAAAGDLGDGRTPFRMVVGARITPRWPEASPRRKRRRS